MNILTIDLNIKNGFQFNLIIIELMLFPWKTSLELLSKKFCQRRINLKY